MATVYRDYGAVQGKTPPSNSFNVIPRRQVYLATHGGDDSRLPFMNRSFISFTFGGKSIEDFNLIATFSNKKLDKAAYSAFNDNVAAYDNLDGQEYWSTHYKTTQLKFTLSTDGMDLKDLDDFKNWFLAGITRELILAEHPNRAQLARVAEPPQLALLPFETLVAFLVAGVERTVTTTLYKGDINLTLVMDKPHWYALDNILGRQVGDRYYDLWKPYNAEDIPENYVEIVASADALKILYEDGIPMGSMISGKFLLGNGAFASDGTDIYCKIWDETLSETVANLSGLTGGGACISGTVNGVTYVGTISGIIVSTEGNGIDTLPTYNPADPDTCGYFFYSGTAPAPTVLTFTMSPQINENYYVSSPSNSFVPATGSNEKYNKIIILSIERQEFKFTTPNYLTSYNRAIKIFSTIFNSIPSKANWEDLRNLLRDLVRHKGAREWAIKVVDCCEEHDLSVTRSNVCTWMSYFLGTVSDGTLTVWPLTCSFNSENGVAIGTVKYRQVTSAIPANDTAWLTYGTNYTGEEDVGDMIKSNYIVLRDRNYTNENGNVVLWSASNKTASYFIAHDLPNPISNIQLLYRNMYL